MEWGVLHKTLAALLNNSDYGTAKSVFYGRQGANYFPGKSNQVQKPKLLIDVHQNSD